MATAAAGTVLARLATRARSSMTGAPGSACFDGTVSPSVAPGRLLPPIDEPCSLLLLRQRHE
jgi:hypothetical protein